jgi:PKD repeat protein
MQNMYPTMGASGAASTPRSSALRGRLVLICLPLVIPLLIGVGIYFLQTESASGLALGYPVPHVHIAPLTTSTVSVGQDISFTATGTGRNLTYTWDFGDQTGASSGETVDHTYANTDESNGFTYTVTVNVDDVLGRSSSDTTTIKVLPQSPTAQFSYNEQYSYYVAFDASGSTVNTQNATYAWDFGDPNNAYGYPDTDTTGSNMDSHDYSGPGTYTVTLTVTDDAGQSNTTTMQVTVT